MKEKEILQYIKNELSNENAEIYLDVDDYKIIVKALERQPCEGCVNRKEVFNILSRNYRGYSVAADGSCVPGNYRECVYDEIKALPFVTPTHKKGKWVAHHNKSDDSHNIDCSCCDYTLVRIVNRNYTEEQALNSTKYMTKNYCPNCGAEMESDG